MKIRESMIRQVGLVVILTALVKIGAFAKDLLLSLQFGAGPQTDAYFIANAIPGFVFGGVFATITLVFLPAFIHASVESDYAASTTFRSAAVAYTTLSAFIGILTFFGAGFFVSKLGPELPETTHDLAVTMTRVMAFSFVFSGWVGLQSAVLQSRKLLIWPQLVQVSNHIFVLCGLFVVAMFGGSITLVVYAALAGWVVIAPLVSIRAATFWPKGAGSWFDKRTILSLAALSFPVFISLSLDQVSILIGTYLGSSFPEGAISHLNYAQRLMLMLSSVFAMVITYVLFPYLTESIVANRVDEARRFMALAIIAVLLLSAPLLVISIVMSEALISFVFQRGAFDQSDAIVTGRILAFFAPVIVLAGLREVLNRLFLAWRQTRSLLIFSFLAMLTNVFASFHFSRAIGLEGIALGAACGAFVYVAAQVIIIVVRHRNLLHPDLPIWFGLIAVASLIAAVVALWLGEQVFFVIARLDFAVDAFIVIAVFGLTIAVPMLAFEQLRMIFKTEQTT